MPTFVHGRNTTVLYRSLNYTGILDNTDYSVDIDMGDATCYGDGWKEYVGGLAVATVGFTGKYDGAAPGNILEANLDDESGPLTWCPGGGAAIGDRARLLKTAITNYTESSPVGDVVTFAWDVVSTDSVGHGWVLHPLAEDTNTTTGASRDDSAATTTGWQAHLHVTALDGGSWVVKLEDSADNSSWADVSNGSFTAVTVAISHRKESLTTTAELRRYIRYTATRTGGSAGDGITFALAYARTV